jgi:hypothetical protein
MILPLPFLFLLLLLGPGALALTDCARYAPTTIYCPYVKNVSSATECQAAGTSRCTFCLTFTCVGSGTACNQRCTTATRVGYCIAATVPSSGCTIQGSANVTAGARCVAPLDVGVGSCRVYVTPSATPAFSATPFPSMAPTPYKYPTHTPTPAPTRTSSATMVMVVLVVVITGLFFTALIVIIARHQRMARRASQMPVVNQNVQMVAPWGGMIAQPPPPPHYGYGYYPAYPAYPPGQLVYLPANPYAPPPPPGYLPEQQPMLPPQQQQQQQQPQVFQRQS